MDRLELDRKAVMKNAAGGAALDVLNRQAAVLIAHHGIRVRQNDDVGRYLEVNAPVAAGELVMLLPPNLLLWEEEVPDFQLCIQIATSSAGARLFSSSITEHDLDNFLCHSCAPNTNPGAFRCAAASAQQPP